MYQMSVKGTPCIILYCHRIGKGKDMLNTEEKYMRAAIKEAKKAYALEEVPIGCVLRTLSDVCRSHCTVTNEKSGDRSDEPKSRMCRFGLKSAADG